MSKQKLALQLKLVPGDVINGFSYSFTKSLYEKLQQLDSENGIWTQGREEDENKYALPAELEDISICLIQHLIDQLKIPLGVNQHLSCDEFHTLMETTEEFLQAFEKQPESASQIDDTILGKDILAILDERQGSEETRTAVEIVNMLKKKYILTPR